MQLSSMLGLRQAFRDPAGLVQALRPFEGAGAFPLRLSLRGLAAEATNGSPGVVEKEMKGAAKTAGHWLSVRRGPAAAAQRSAPEFASELLSAALPGCRRTLSSPSPVCSSRGRASCWQ